MINSTAFDYVNVLTKAADASYQREAILANNISNVDTPGYKRKDLNFEGVLSQELGRCKHQSLDKKISELDTSKLTANISLRQGVDLMSFTTRLLTVLVVFYIIGAILKVILSCAFKAMEDRQKKAEAAEAKTDDSEVFDNDDDNDKPIS